MLVSGPELVTAARCAGVMAGLPAHNARNLDEFDRWLGEIEDAINAHNCAAAAPLAVNISARRNNAEIDQWFDVSVARGVRVFITAMGDPAHLAEAAHARGALLYHDITTLRHAEKAIAAGVDGLICIGAGGGGHSGRMNPLAMIPAIRAIFDGTIVLAGCASNGAAIRAAEILGADLCYVGTRFIASTEARAPQDYKKMVRDCRSIDLVFTDKVSGVSANWLKPSLSAVGAMAPDARSDDVIALPEGVRPWRDVWSAGQGVDLIDDILPVAKIVDRLKAEYRAACETPHWSVA